MNALQTVFYDDDIISCEVGLGLVYVICATSIGGWGQPSLPLYVVDCSAMADRNMPQCKM